MTLETEEGGILNTIRVPAGPRLIIPPERTLFPFSKGCLAFEREAVR